MSNKFFSLFKLQHFRQNNENGVCAQVRKEQLGQQWQNSDGQPHHTTWWLKALMAHWHILWVCCSFAPATHSSSFAIFCPTWSSHSTYFDLHLPFFLLQLPTLDNTFETKFLQNHCELCKYKINETTFMWHAASLMVPHHSLNTEPISSWFPKQIGNLQSLIWHRLLC